MSVRSSVTRCFCGRQTRIHVLLHQIRNGNLLIQCVKWKVWTWISCDVTIQIIPYNSNVLRLISGSFPLILSGLAQEEDILILGSMGLDFSHDQTRVTCDIFKSHEKVLITVGTFLTFLQLHPSRAYPATAPRHARRLTLSPPLRNPRYTTGLW